MEHYASNIGQNKYLDLSEYDKILNLRSKRYISINSLSSIKIGQLEVGSAICFS